MRRLLSMSVVMLLTVLAVAQNNNVIDEIVWLVGDEAIFKSDVEQERIQAQMQGVRWDGDPYCLIPEELAIQKLFINQAAIDSITATEAEISEQVEYTIQYLIDQHGSVEKLEEYQDMRLSDIREHLGETIRNRIITQKMRSHITEGVKVSPADVRRYIKDLPLDRIPSVPTQVEVEIITREPKIPQEEIDAVKAELRDYTERIQNGTAQFSTLALLYSEDGSARHGGELGFVSRADVVPEFAAVAFNLTDPKKVSKIVETEYGYHIIQLIEKRGDRVNVRHILKKPRVPEEAVQDALNVLDSIADEIRSEKFTFEEGAKYLSFDKDTRNNNGLMSHLDEENRSVSRFEMQQLPAEVARAVENMHIGEVSDPFTMLTPDGRKVCAIVKLKSRINGHKASVAEDFQVLQKMVLENKCEEAIDKWIREKQKITYVKIFDGWNECEFRHPGWVLQ
ncbi:MAG: peptidylprolyl isomerase [Bacteroidaceae bacterium]|nr:peptidylprolyl isomerase [Bacteroidaceae bacterium]